MYKAGGVRASNWGVHRSITLIYANALRFSALVPRYHHHLLLASPVPIPPYIYPGRFLVFPVITLYHHLVTLPGSFSVPVVWTVHLRTLTGFCSCPDYQVYRLCCKKNTCYCLSIIRQLGLMMSRLLLYQLSLYGFFFRL